MMKFKVGSPAFWARLSTSWYADLVLEVVMVLGSMEKMMSTPPAFSVDSRWDVSGMGLKVIWSR